MALYRTSFLLLALAATFLLYPARRPSRAINVSGDGGGAPCVWTRSIDASRIAVVHAAVRRTST